MTGEDETFRVKQAVPREKGLGVVRLAPYDMKRLELSPGEVVKVEGEGVTAAKAMPANPGIREKGTVRIDGVGRNNAQAGLDERVKLEKWPANPADTLHLEALTVDQLDRHDREYLRSSLENNVVTEGDVVRAKISGSQAHKFKVTGLAPQEPVVVTTSTKFVLKTDGSCGAESSPISYEDIGGLDEAIRRVREMVELPLKFPQLFTKLGVDPPKGVLLHGPPGTGKTLLAKALAYETNASFYHIGGPEIIGKYYGESEARLRKVFEKAEEDSPAIVFIDEIDAIASSREELSGEKQVERRVVAQLLSLMDGLESRGEVVVIGATNISSALDPALRRPGRFDREVEIGIPDKCERAEIIEIKTRSMPLGEDVDLNDLASATHGYVGADLESLAKEAAMASLRRVFPRIDFESSDIPFEAFSKLKVTPGDFQAALQETGPSALREVFTEVPDVTWSDVGGLADVRRRIEEAIQWPIEHKDLFEETKTEPPGGVLLHGPPGTGKTLLAKVVAHESEANFISVNTSELMSKWIGEAEKQVTKTFQRARHSAPCILFLDEIDSLTPTRGSSGGNQVSERVVSQLLVELDGIEKLTGVVVIGATNRPDIIDPALLRAGRLELQLELTAPDRETRKEIFRVHSEGKPLAGSVSFDELAAETEGFVGADIESVCQRASMRAIRRSVTEGGRPRISSRDFKNAVAEVSGSPVGG